ncbi:hypothetical protein [Caulobacter sp. DWR1-3-2b1]|uniref:hypothetical protein n=1 Tax=Caulobacter sp. DWR1-3-2b1 TaxID=2804670 RepID=UPI003CE7099C
MNRTINRLKIIFVGLFLVSTLAVLGYHYLWVWPKERCEARGGAWAGRWLKCGTIYSIETLTRRPLNVPPINGEAPETPTPTPAPTKK